MSGHPLGRRQRGLAALLVVMVLLFVVSLVAAYANRGMIFEQRTSANQARAARALAAAEAGVDWALAMLNSGRITGNCQSGSATVADPSFRSRYLEIDPATGHITARKRSDGVSELYPSCVYDGAAWNCDCPEDSPPSLSPPAGSDIYPAFRVRFRTFAPAQPGLVHVEVNGCTVLSDTCLGFPGSPVAGEGRTTVHVVAALKGALPAAPAAALTARGTVDVAGALQLFNTEATGSGITLLAGLAVNPPSPYAPIELRGRGGTPGPLTVIDGDGSLAALSPDRMFANTFGLTRGAYRDQPGLVFIDCGGGCSSATVRAKVDLNPGRVFWLQGNVDFDGSGDIGSADLPVVINVTGSATFSGNVTVYGLVYSQAATWTASGAGSVIGAAIAEGGFAGNATTAIVYSVPVLERLRRSTGSYVRVPGTWKDFAEI